MRTLLAVPLLFSAMAISVSATAAEPDHFNWGSNTAVIFHCDFTQFPPMANVEITHEGSRSSTSIIASVRPQYVRLPLLVAACPSRSAGSALCGGSADPTADRAVSCRDPGPVISSLLRPQ
jgi:hypothetical protein